MMSPISSSGIWHAAAEAVAPYAAQAAVAWVPVVAVIAAGILRLLMEWQLRRTLAVIFEQAPGGSVVAVRNRGLGGTMYVMVGSRYLGARPGRAELT